MRRNHLAYLCCPGCHGDLQLAGSEQEVLDGKLTCVGCEAVYPVIAAIPRFVPRDNYANGFGMQWNRHARTQYDSVSGVPLSEHRIFTEAELPRHMPGALIVEAGSGSGRFTEQLLRTGATVLSFDYSDAVAANFASNGAHPNLLLVQADIYQPPIRKESADAVVCLGVIQHTPDPRSALLALPPLLKPGGLAVADIYRKSPLKRPLSTKYWIRPFTRGRNPQRLYERVVQYVDLMWPVANVVRRLPRGASINWRLLVADYSNVGVPKRALREWAYLNTFDMLAPVHDSPQTERQVRDWLADAGVDGEVARGLNGVAVRMRR